MAVTEHASAPADVSQAGSGGITTASFSPPANSFVVVMVSASKGTATTAIDVTDNAVGGSWDRVQRQSASANFGAAAVAYRWFPRGATGLQVSAAFTNLSASGGSLMSVRVLQGMSLSSVLNTVVSADYTVAGTAFNEPVAMPPGGLCYGAVAASSSGVTWTTFTGDTAKINSTINGTSASATFKSVTIFAARYGLVASGATTGCFAALSIKQEASSKLNFTTSPMPIESGQLTAMGDRRLIRSANLGGPFTTTSSTLAKLNTSSSVDFMKQYDDTYLHCDVGGHFTSVAATSTLRLAVGYQRDSGTPGTGSSTLNFPFSTSSISEHFSGIIPLTGLAAGPWTLSIYWARTAGAGTLQTSAGFPAYLRVREVRATE